MKNLTVRERLLGSAAAGVCGALAVVAFPTGAAAQTTTCSQTGTSGSCVDGATPIASGFVDATTVVASGPGFVPTDPATVTVPLVPAGNGPIHTTGAGETGVSVGALGDMTVTFAGGSVLTEGDGAAALRAAAVVMERLLGVQAVNSR